MITLVIPVWVWTHLVAILGGGVLFIYLTLKIFPPEDDIEIKFGKVKVKVRGKQNNVDDVLDVTDVLDLNKYKGMTAKERRQAIREARRELKNKGQ